MAAAVREEVKATKTATVDEVLMMVATEAMAGIVQGPMEVVATAAKVMKTMTSNGRHLWAKRRFSELAREAFCNQEDACALQQ
jgi:hypothetical protein